MLILSILTSVSVSAASPQALPPSPLPGYSYDQEFFPGATYDPAVPTPDAILGFKVGSQAATPDQIEAVITALAAHSRRVKLVRYATSHEGRGLHYLVIASENNLTKLDDLRVGLDQLADPRALSVKDGDRLTKSLPAVAWLAYSIHGDELSGADAGLVLAHHLAAGTGDDVTSLLKELTIIIDPLMNPDGRARCLAAVAQNRTAQPSIDDQSLLHSDIWPGGRTNHYLFDLNRDWLWATQPETRGRLEAIGDWHPHYLLESHEMWPQDTFLFSPSRPPKKPNFPQQALRWSERFAEDHAKAFDARGWRYYVGEWNEEWYPGYSSTWAPLRGAIASLFEQAGIVTDAVRRAEGTLETYREAVHKQLVSSVSNLNTLARNREAILRDFVAEKRACVSDDGSQEKRTWAILPTSNRARWNQFLDLIQIQGLEVYRAEAPFKSSGIDRLGLEISDREFPVGTLLLPERQPEARLIATLMEFDPRMSTHFLTEVRRELIRFDRSKLYDVTGWSATMLFDLDCITITGEMPAAAKAIRVDAANSIVESRPLENESTTVAFIIDGADDASVIAAGRLMERGVRVRVADKALAFDGRDYGRGSVLISRIDNTFFDGDLPATVAEVAAMTGTEFRGLHTGMGAGDLPDLGGEHFILLRTPRIAVLGKEPFRSSSFGECWYTIDHVLGLRASYLDFHDLEYTDLRRYNVIILPSAPAEALEGVMDALKSWVEAGGTLVAIGGSTGAIARETGGIGSIRQLPDILAQPEPYLQAIIREWEGRTTTVDADAVWSHTAPTGKNAPVIPWLGTGVADGDDQPDKDELLRRDAWREIFMPHGVIVAGRVDDRPWLTAGAADYLPINYQADHVLMVPPGVEAPVRIGTFHPAPVPIKQPAPDEDGTKGEAGEKEDPVSPGWTIAPPGFELRVRMSGLLWPEATERIANSAGVARESVGAGQVILFASDPLFRASTPGTARLFTNAVVCGPGMGADQPIDL